jgi:hypothetical protein
VVITELWPRPDTLPETEFVELFNSGPDPVTLYDPQLGLPWRLGVEDGDTEAVALELPTNPALTLAPGACALLIKNRRLFELRFTGLSSQLQVVQWDQGNLPDTAATVRLLRPLQTADGQIAWIEADAMAYSATAAGKSWQRSAVSAFGLDAAHWRPAAPSPGTQTP